MKPQVIAHRGASSAYRENTLAAFAAAEGLGADWVELDVRSTADDLLVVHHDPSPADHSLLRDLLAAQLPDHIPTLDAALAACGSLGVNVEIKQLPTEADFDPAYGQLPAIVAAIEAWGGEVLVSSFDPVCLQHLRDRAHELPTAQLVHPLLDAVQMADLAAEAGHRALHPHDGAVDEALVRRCRERGLQINVWTVDDPDRIRALADLGVDGIVTNDVATARAVLDS